ncbi:MAG: hypothetical protein KUA43_12355 [Hoeflea sp.]|uniref:hypothetical protein n=1 Tax=Hoeflea sp. TaxID=1940281 RepID=UPI001DA6001C|nr:hypothetical protein [Hoeflea sp.]MBU4527804.1 hypothetical protein [Alphaproteobacteria bacterium]MBU4546161.1 hypothetical protein [Alphaproteobacteria bacterium]MBU4553154.1 hypothetical protein [Alphaproteobacteria bacterium]MBV1724226.1 hypothetical protein [Hoeflea sp.]MBV1759911.1 hypothetical protein [Hoeflea sp.]
MEWDQIANSWAAMTHRLRSDRIANLRFAGGSQDARRILKGADEEPSGNMPLETSVNDNGLSNQ